MSKRESEGINKNVLDEILYEVRRLRAGLGILTCIEEENIAAFSYLELLQLVLLFHDQTEKYIDDADEIIKSLVGAGAKEWNSPHESEVTA